MRLYKRILLPVLVAAIVLSVVPTSVSAATFMVSPFQRSWGAITDFYWVNNPVREAYHRFQSTGGPLGDGWWSDGNYMDHLPNGWNVEYRSDGRDEGYVQAERHLYKFDTSGAIKILADSSSILDKKIYTEFTAPQDGTYRFVAFAMQSKYNRNGLDQYMKVSVNGVDVKQKKFAKSTSEWKRRKIDVEVNAGDVVRFYLIASQDNWDYWNLADVYFTLPKKGTGKIL